MEGEARPSGPNRLGRRSGKRSKKSPAIVWLWEWDPLKLSFMVERMRIETLRTLELKLQTESGKAWEKR